MTRVTFLILLGLIACHSSDVSSLSKPILRAAISNGTTYPTSWNEPAWYVDPSNVSGNASDTNSCTSASSPCLTWNQINAGRWGCLGNPGGCPRLKQATTITFLSSHTDGSDPVVFTPFVFGAGSATLVGSILSSTTTTLSAVTPKSYAVGSNSLLKVTLPVSTTVGTMIENETHSSRARVYASLGGNVYAMTQPFAIMTPTQSVFPPRVDTWTAGDTVHLLTQTAVNLASIQPVQADWNASRTNPTVLYNLTGFDPGGLGADDMSLGPDLMIVECAFQRSTFLNSGAKGEGFPEEGHDTGHFGYPVFLSDQFLGGIYFLGGFEVIGGAVQGGVFSSINTSGSAVQSYLDADFIIGNTLVIWGGGLAIDTVYLDSNLTIFNASIRCIDEGKGYSDQIWYGNNTAVVQMNGFARLENHDQTFAEAFVMPSLITTGFKMNQGNLVNNTACSHTGGSPDVWYCGITPNVPNLDAATGPSGFGGHAVSFAGASISTEP